MKTFIFSALALGMMASCSNSEIDEIIDNGEPVAVEFTAGVHVAATTRAAVDNGDEFTASVFGWNTTGEAVPNYLTEATWSSETENIKASKDGGAEVKLTVAQFYQPNSEDKTYVKAVSPTGGTFASGEYTFNPVLTGQEDVLLTTGNLSGSRKSDKIALSFSHVLTRFNFLVAKGDHFGDGVKVSKITVKGATLPTSINLSTAAITATAVSELDIAVNNVEIVGAPGNSAGEPIMIVPCAATSLTLDITTNNGTFENVSITPTTGSNFEIGTSYTVTLTFTGKSVGASSTVGEWTSSTGSGNPS